MAKEIPEGEPRQFVAGDTVIFTKSLVDYVPADGWALRYRLVGPIGLSTAPIADVLATVAVDGTGWKVSFAKAATAAVKSAGSFRLFGWVELLGERYTVFDAPVRILANAETATPAEQLTHEERALAAIEARIDGRLIADLESYQVDGRSVMKIPMKELLQMRANYRLRVWKQRHPGKAAPSRKVVFNAVD